MLLAAANLFCLSESAQAWSARFLTSTSDRVAALKREPPASTRPLTLLPAQPASSAVTAAERRVSEMVFFMVKY
ncbi:hypothetical protein D3C81_1962820 [compost metagenome]